MDETVHDYREKLIMNKIQMKKLSESWKMIGKCEYLKNGNKIEYYYIKIKLLLVLK